MNREKNADKETNPLLVDSREAARLLCISERTLWTHMKSGNIPHIKIGRSVRYDREDLKEWIEKQKSEPSVQKLDRREKKGLGV